MSNPAPTERYQSFIEGYARLCARHQLVLPDDYRPLLVGVFWPSIVLLTERKMNLRGMTIDETKRALAAGGASPDLVERITRELETADYARFAPGTLDKTQLTGALD